MYIYSGNFNWGTYSANDLIILVLPNGGPVRDGDPAYLFTFWTKVHENFQDGNWSRLRSVSKVIKDQEGDWFTISDRYWHHNCYAKDSYKTLVFRMINPSGSKQEMTLNLHYETPTLDEEHDFETRIWTGKVTWYKDITDQPYVIVAPEGLGSGKPITAYWTGDGPNKVRNEFIATQEWKDGSANHFVFQDRRPSPPLFVHECQLSPSTDQLAVTIHYDNQTKEQTPLQLSATLGTHLHGLTPRLVPDATTPTDLYLPQSNPVLKRIHDPMPFPNGLIDTLTYTASFVDQAGYLAKFAINRHKEIDTLYHSEVDKASQLSGSIKQLEKSIAEEKDQNSKLQGEIEAEKQKGADLEKRLAAARDEAAKTEADLTQKIQQRDKTIAKDKDHDAADHKALDDINAALRQAQDTDAKLTKELDETKTSLKAAQTQVKTLTDKISALTAETLTLKSEIEATKAQNTALTKENVKLKARVAKLTADLASVTKDLSRTKEDLQSAQEEVQDRDQTITDLELGMKGLQRDLDAKERALAALKQALANK